MLEDKEESGYTCVEEKKEEEERYGWTIKQRKRNQNWEILSQYFYNIFAINFRW